MQQKGARWSWATEVCIKRGWPTILVWLACGLAQAPAFDSVRQGAYLVLTANDRHAAPFGSVTFSYGPSEQVNGQRYHWWQLELRADAALDTPPLVTVRALTDRTPLEAPPSARALRFERYLVRIPALGETLEYRERRSGRAALPRWADFGRWFLPHPVPGASHENGLPRTCELLGHVLSLHHTSGKAAWEAWPEAKILTLDPELLIGTSRPFRDQEGHRLPQHPQRQDYHYVPFTEADYRRMIEAGFNLFTVRPEQERWVRAEPVFYVRGVGGDPPLRFPADLYRANYLGPVMFMDEPSIRMVGDPNVHKTLRWFSDAAALIEKRTRATFLSEGNYGSFALQRALRERGIALGDMRLQQVDYPSWETLGETAFYQMRGGGAGLVHEGRYRLEGFDQAVQRFTGSPRKHTAEEMLKFYYALLRGGTRPFGKSWGTAI